jgi:DNA-directed RNA polymerase subunit RPC12/RpoP
MARDKRPRAARRALERATQKEMQLRERLAGLELGGSPSRPIEISSASLVEVTAEGTACPRCGGRMRVEEHLAQTLGGVPLRIAWVRCSTCGHKRAIHFRIVVALPS